MTVSSIDCHMFFNVLVEFKIVEKLFSNDVFNFFINNFRSATQIWAFPNSASSDATNSANCNLESL